MTRLTESAFLGGLTNHGMHDREGWWRNKPGQCIVSDFGLFTFRLLGMRDDHWERENDLGSAHMMDQLLLLLPLPLLLLSLLLLSYV